MVVEYSLPEHVLEGGCAGGDAVQESAPCPPAFLTAEKQRAGTQRPGRIGPQTGADGRQAEAPSRVLDRCKAGRGARSALVAEPPTRYRKKLR